MKTCTSAKPIVDNRSVSVSLKLKTKKVYIPHFKRNNKENAHFARLDKGKSFDVGAEISKSMSKPTASVQKKFVFLSTYHLCGVVGHIRPNCSLLKQKPKSETKFAVRNTDVSKFVHVCHFCGVSGYIHPNCHKLKFKYFVF